jgi:desulfoferrodoxin-like iron-binding protein
MANQAGKRLKCQSCGVEIVVTKGGEGTVICCGQPMGLKQ